ncbi:alpha/beta-hydrolase [Lindgomyces ingoldianus]|uniref:Alpha/beta-hydrolase n=1 Tax=Lindgomyces ingoldianus TaxID=673940 RepID=A0ACB6RDI0_9PLEO|nr:alpha/beta-hydrolase [Lindgomyces ingoldianus]KAF2477393.1 alpha/beta-hydrolase [Lindgomyces ingoldianus]
MPLEPINPVSDPRIERKTAVLNGFTYHYLYGVPPGEKLIATVFLIHGWPDLSLGWRYQIPLLLDMGFRIVAPDMMGYGGTDAPKVPPNPINLYGLKRASDDIAELARQLGAEKIILGGHDWGGFVVWRAAQWHPELISHVFSVCTPYTAPQKEYLSLEDLVKSALPQFAYQIHLASGEVEKSVNSEESVRQFLKGLYGGRGPNGEYAFDPHKGVLPENLSKIGNSKILNGKVLDYYVKEYSRHGIHSTLNWYRTRMVNWEEDLALQDKKTISIPTLFVQATYDSVLKPEMSKTMEAFLPNLTRGEVAATHWALTQKPEEVNAILRNWLKGQGFGTKSSL